MSIPVAFHPGRPSARRLVAALALLIPALALGAGQSAPAVAQGYETPTMSIETASCPDDIAYGDSLADQCQTPRAGTEISVGGPVSSSATTGDNGRAIIQGLELGNYTVSDPSVDSDRVSLIECHASEGFGGYLNLPVTYGDDSGSFTVDLTNQSAKVGTSDSCTWYDLPAAAFERQPAGLSVTSANSTDGSLTGLSVVPADGTRMPLSGAGPAIPSSTVLDLTITGSALDSPLDLQSGEPTNSMALSASTLGPILLAAGDYTLDDTTNDLSTELTLVAGAVTDVAAIAPADAGDAPASPSGVSLQYPGTQLAGAWTDLSIPLYGDQAGALYGASSGYDTGTLTFDGSDFNRDAPATVTLLGLDDELAASATMTVTLNGTEIYRGDSTFPAWDEDATGNQWGELPIDIDPGVLATGNDINELTITDLSPGSTVGTPPWVMITLITISQ